MRKDRERKRRRDNMEKEERDKERGRHRRRDDMEEETRN